MKTCASHTAKVIDGSEGRRPQTGIFVLFSPRLLLYQLHANDFPPTIYTISNTDLKIFVHAHKAPGMFRLFFIISPFSSDFFSFPPYQAVTAESSRVQKAAENSVPTHEKAYATLNFWQFHPPTDTSSTCECSRG